MTEYKIYCATHNPTETRYVGLTKVPLLKRIGQHLALTEYKRGPFQSFLHTTSYGEWTWDVLFTVKDANQAYKLEAETIRDYQAVYGKLLNVLSVDKTKQDPTKWLQDHQFKSGKVPWNKGKTGVYSEETILKMRIGKLRNPTRIPPSPETILRIKMSQGKPVMCLETGVVYLSVGEAAVAFKTARGSIRKVCSGQAKSAAGHTFKFIDKTQ